MRRQRGATLVEILISLAVVLIGMMAMFRVLASSVTGASSASRVSQAQFRAQVIMEAIRGAPAAGLICLAATAPANWSACEAQCRAALGATASPQSCIFTIASMNVIPTADTVTTSNAHSASGLTVDRNLQGYALMIDGNKDARDTFVQLAGTNNRVYDVQVSVGWNDNGTAVSPNHAVTLHTGVFQ